MNITRERIKLNHNILDGFSHGDEKRDKYGNDLLTADKSCCINGNGHPKNADFKTFCDVISLGINNVATVQIILNKKIVACFLRNFISFFKFKKLLKTSYWINQDYL
jgi:hypothetical protein